MIARFNVVSGLWGQTIYITVGNRGVCSEAPAEVMAGGSGHGNGGNGVVTAAGIAAEYIRFGCGGGGGTSVYVVVTSPWLIAGGGGGCTSNTNPSQFTYGVNGGDGGSPSGSNGGALSMGSAGQGAASSGTYNGQSAIGGNGVLPIGKLSPFKEFRSLFV